MIGSLLQDQRYSLRGPPLPSDANAQIEPAPGACRCNSAAQGGLINPHAPQCREIGSALQWAIDPQAIQVNERLDTRPRP
jgi:hypothetical protein